MTVAARRFNALKDSYPSQFWVILLILIASSTAVSFVWPFLAIFFREKLGASLTVATSFLAIESMGTIASAYALSSLMDKHGRKWIGVGSLAVHGLLIIGMVLVHEPVLLGLLAFGRGIVNPLFRMAAETMIADLIREDQRVDAYAMLRVGANVGFALGPILGGILVAISYSIDFILAGVLLLLIAVYAAKALRESLNLRQAHPGETPSEHPKGAGSGSIGKIVKDGFFMAFFTSDLLVKMASMLLFSIMSVYLKENAGISETQYGLLMAINATMGVAFQFTVTRLTKRHNALRMLALGGLLYSIGVLSIAWGSTFLHFTISIIIATVAELIFLPTAINEVARIAPFHMRARYLGFYSLAFGLSRGFSPLMGGLLSDIFFPKAIWYGGALLAGIGSIGLLLLSQAQKSKPGRAV